jgi:predicted RNase H-like HicB family nuclease
MAESSEIEFVFEPQEDGGYHVYAPDLPGLHTEGDTLDEAADNAAEALALYVEGLRDDGLGLPAGVIRRRLPIRRERTHAGCLRGAADQGAGARGLGAGKTAWESRPAQASGARNRIGRADASGA